MTLGTKPRWDKYNGYVGNFRSHLAADTTADMANLVLGVGLNSSGLITPGFGQIFGGLLILPVGNDYISGTVLPGPQAGDAIDVGKHGEIVNFVPTTYDGEDGFATGTSAAGTAYFAHADGSVTATRGADGIYVGHTVEASRLIVNVVENLGAVTIGEIQATGTPGATTYLRGDGAWVVNAP